MNPITVKLWSSEGAVHRFLDTGLTTETNCCAAEAIFNKMHEVLQGYNIPWSNNGSLAFELPTFWAVDQHRNHWATTALDTYTNEYFYTEFLCVLWHKIHGGTAAFGCQVAQFGPNCESYTPSLRCPNERLYILRLVTVPFYCLY